jgi:hypothetical protein
MAGGSPCVGRCHGRALISSDNSCARVAFDPYAGEDPAQGVREQRRGKPEELGNGLGAFATNGWGWA